MDTESAIRISFRLVIRPESGGQKRFGVILGGICGNRGRIQPDKRGIHDPFFGKKEDL